MTTSIPSPIVVALDVPTSAEARTLAGQIGDAAGFFKFGLELAMAEGPAAVADALEGYRLFADMKLHDIPTTVARAMKNLRPLGLELVNVHALGGRSMLEAAAEQKGETKLLAVTILTSLSDADLKEIGLPQASEAVPMLAQLAMESGCDGVVCAPPDVAGVRALCPSPFLIVTPGIRPAGADAADQARIATPKGAMEAGADLLVIGRPITGAVDPRAATLEILEGLR